VTGGPANDTIDCGGTSPGKTITGGVGNDVITGTAEADTISGGDGNGTIGAGNDVLDGGLGIDTISGSAGNDSLVGPSLDGSRDSLDGGLNTDTCQGPAPDPGGHASCENTTVPPVGSSSSLSGPLCQASGGIYADVSPLLYTCVFPGLFMSHRAAEARRICGQRRGVFADLPLDYSCVLPGGAQAARSGASV
jgi:Ca2+-binding RTX toxin-like protein